MLKWTFVFFIIALVTAVLGFGELAGSLSIIAQLLFLFFLVLFVISLIFNRHTMHHSAKARLKGEQG